MHVLLSENASILRARLFVKFCYEKIYPCRDDCATNSVNFAVSRLYVVFNGRWPLDPRSARTRRAADPRYSILWRIQTSLRGSRSGRLLSGVIVSFAEALKVDEGFLCRNESGKNWKRNDGRFCPCVFVVIIHHVNADILLVVCLRFFVSICCGWPMV